MAAPSLHRVGSGLGLAILIGAPVGILLGRSRLAREVANAPFRFLRMISPLSSMPIAVMAFAAWDGAIAFLIFARDRLAGDVRHRRGRAADRSGLA